MKNSVATKFFYSYRIEKAMSMWNNVCQKNETVMYKEIIYAIDFHRTAIKFVFIY